MPGREGTMSESPRSPSRFPGGIPQGAQGADLAFYTIADRYLDDSMRAYPTGSTMAGYHEYDGLLEDLGAAAILEKIDMARRFQAELAPIDPRSLTTSARIDHRLVTNDVDATLLSLSELRPHERDPQSYVDLLGNSTLYLTLRDPGGSGRASSSRAGRRSSAGRARAAAARSGRGAWRRRRWSPGDGRCGRSWSATGDRSARAPPGTAAPCRSSPGSRRRRGLRAGRRIRDSRPSSSPWDRPASSRRDTCPRWCRRRDLRPARPAECLQGSGTGSAAIRSSFLPGPASGPRESDSITST